MSVGMVSLPDSNCSLQGAQILRDYSCMLNQVNIGANANKFYLIQVLVKGTDTYLWKRWGRVGSVGQHSLAGPQSEHSSVRSFETSFRDKTSLDWSDKKEAPKDGCYAYMQLDAPNTSAGSNVSGQVTVSAMVRPVIPATDPNLDPRVCAVIREICNERLMANAMAVTYQIDVERLPLGKLSVEQLDNADKVLKSIDDALRAHSVSKSLLEQLSSRFWTLVPQASKLNQRLPVIESPEMINKLVDTLNGLRNIQVAAVGLQRSRTLFDLYNTLGVTLQPCIKEEVEYLALMLDGTTSSVHKSKIVLVDAFRLCKVSQDSTDVGKRFEKLEDHRMLFHGSRTSNFMGILTEGLRIPRADQVANGSTLGLGCYFADCSTKSLQYCGLSDGETGYMLICELALGNKHIVHGCHSSLIMPTHDSRVARGRKTVDYVKCNGVWYPKGPIRPKSDTTFTTFEHNELVIADGKQYRFRYLLKIKRQTPP